MKQFIRKFFAAAMLLSMTFAFSSCEGSLDDVFGTWDKPSNVSPQVFMFKNALEKNGTLTVNFTLNDVPSSVTITSDGENFTVTSSTLSASNFKFDKVDGVDMVVLTITDGSEKLYGQIFFNTSDGSYYILNNIDCDVTFDGKVSVNGVSGSVTNLCPDKTEIGIDVTNDNTPDKTLIVYYNKTNSETWKDVAKRYGLDFRLSGVLYAADGDRTPQAYDAAAAEFIIVADGASDNFVVYVLPFVNSDKIADIAVSVPSVSL